MSQCDLTFDLSINLGQGDLYGLVIMPCILKTI